MANLLSPGVAVTTKDLSQVTTAAGDSAACFCGDFIKGPVNAPTLISSVAELKETFGGPTKANYNQWYQCYNFLQYSGELYVVRAADINGTLTETDFKYSSAGFKGNTITTETETKIHSINDNIIQLTDEDDDSVGFIKSTKFQVSDTIKFDGDNKTYKVLSAEEKQIQIKNPDYIPLNTLKVSVTGGDNGLYEGQKLGFDYDCLVGFPTWEVVSDVENILSIDPVNQIITLNKAGSGIVNFSSQAIENQYRAQKLQFSFEVQEFTLVPGVTSVQVKPNETYNLSVKATKGSTVKLEIVSGEEFVSVKDLSITGLKLGSAVLRVVGELNGVQKTVVIPVTISDSEVETPTFEGTLEKAIIVNGKKTLTFKTAQENDIVTAEVTDGSISYEGKTVTFTAPSTAQPVTIKIYALRNGVQSAPLTVTVKIVEKPNAPVVDGVVPSVTRTKSIEIPFNGLSEGDVLKASADFGDIVVNGNKVTYTADKTYLGTFKLTTYINRYDIESERTTTQIIVRPNTPVLNTEVSEIEIDQTLELDYTIQTGETLEVTSESGIGTITVNGSKATYVSNVSGVDTIIAKVIAKDKDSNNIESLSLETSVTVNVRASDIPNKPELLTSISSVTANSENALTFKIDEGSTLVASAANGTTQVNGSVVTYTAGNEAGQDTITAYATKNGANSESLSINVTIKPVKPVLAASNPTSVTAGETLDLSYEISEGSTLVASATNGTTQVNASTVTYTAGNEAGTDTVTVKVTKNGIESDEVQTTVTINAKELENVTYSTEPTEINIADSNTATLTVTTEGTISNEQIQDSSIATVSLSEKTFTITPVANGETNLVFTLSQDGYKETQVTIPVNVSGIETDEES